MCFAVVDPYLCVDIDVEIHTEFFTSPNIAREKYSKSKLLRTSTLVVDMCITVVAMHFPVVDRDVCIDIDDEK